MKRCNQINKIAVKLHDYFLENVLFPTRKFGTQESTRAFAHSLLERFGLKDKMRRLPRQFSGGEQQRSDKSI